MPRPPRALPTALAAAFTVGAAREAGVSEGRLRAQDLMAPFRGIRMQAGRDEPTVSDRDAVIALARAYSLQMPADAMFTHLTAAVIWGLPVQASTVLDVSSIAPRRAPRAKGVRGRRLQKELTAQRDVSGLRVSSPATTWAQLGSLVGDVLTVDDLIAVGDAIVRVPRLKSGHAGDPRSALATIDQLRRAMDAGRRRGATALRTALEAVRVGSASLRETALRLVLIRDGLPEPELDVEVYGDRGELVGVTEIAYPQWRVLVEYEGDHHRVDRRQWNRDIDKYEQYAALGWRVVRITAAHLHRGVAAARVRAALEAAGWRRDSA